MKPGGTSVERLTDSPTSDDQAAFSKDGQQIVFVTTRPNGPADLWTLTGNQWEDDRPVWRPIPGRRPQTPRH